MSVGALLLAAFGLMLVFEGLAYALAPDMMKRMAAMIASLSPEDLRRSGLMAAIIGALLAYVVVRFA